MGADEMPGANPSPGFCSISLNTLLLHVFQLAKAVRKQRG